jgi:hypothetical protein
MRFMCRCRGDTRDQELKVSELDGAQLDLTVAIACIEAGDLDIKVSDAGLPTIMSYPQGIRPCLWFPFCPSRSPRLANPLLPAC